MKYLKMILLLVLISSCSKKNVELPKLGEKGITNIYNTSEIWMFFKIENNDTLVEVNPSNKIINTNLIFHIDKRLPIKLVIPEIHKIQKKLKEKSIHQTAGMKNYFSYADTISKTFSLLDFTDTNYILDIEQFDKYYDQIRNDSTKIPVILEIKKNNSDHQLSELKKRFQKDTTNIISIILKLEENMYYQEYLSVKATLINSKFPIEQTEFVYGE